MSITASTTITELPLWALLATSAVIGALVAGAAAHLIARFARLRRGGAADVNGVDGVANRRAFVERIEADWRAARDGGGVFGLIVIDVDAFAEINHVYGREAGDRVLVEVAERIRLRVRRDDFVARVDADEFAVICQEASERELEAIRGNLEAYVNFAELVPVSLSIGIAALDDADGQGIDMLERARQSLAQRRGVAPLHLVDDALTDLLAPR